MQSSVLLAFKSVRLIQRGIIYLLEWEFATAAKLFCLTAKEKYFFWQRVNCSHKNCQVYDLCLESFEFYKGMLCFIKLYGLFVILRMVVLLGVATTEPDTGKIQPPVEGATIWHCPLALKQHWYPKPSGFLSNHCPRTNFSNFCECMGIENIQLGRSKHCLADLKDH